MARTDVPANTFYGHATHTLCFSQCQCPRGDGGFRREWGGIQGKYGLSSNPPPSSLTSGLMEGDPQPPEVRRRSRRHGDTDRGDMELHTDAPVTCLPQHALRHCNSTPARARSKKGNITLPQHEQHKTT